MKTRQSIAMALTIVLSLAAGTLLVWQVSLRQSNDRAAALDTAEFAVTPVAETGRMLDSPDVAQANTIARQLGDSAPDCQFGFRQEYNSDGGKGDYHCLNSAYWDYTTETLEQMVYADAEAARVLACNCQPRMPCSTWLNETISSRMASRLAITCGNNCGILPTPRN